MHFSIVLSCPVAVLCFTNAVYATSNPRAFCSIVRSEVTKYHEQSSATAFCSSYLHIRPQTTTSTTSTSTTTTVTHVKTKSRTVTVTSTIAPICGTPPGFTPSSSPPATTPTPLHKRAIGAADQALSPDATPSTKIQSQAKPNAFSLFNPSSLISSACSCLHIPTPTTTIITTTTITSTETAQLTTTISSTTVQNVPGPIKTPASFQIWSSYNNNYPLLFNGQTPGFILSYPHAGDQPKARFSLRSDHLIYTPEDKNLITIGYADDDPNYPGFVVTSYYPGQSAPGYLLLTCHISATAVGDGYGCALLCQATTPDGTLYNITATYEHSFVSLEDGRAWILYNSTSAAANDGATPFMVMVQADS